MADRVPSDHATVESHRVTVESVGRTDRRRIPLPDALAVEPGDVVRLTAGGADYHGQVSRTLDAGPAITGAFDNPRLARADEEGTDRLAEWLDDASRAAGQSVLLDVLVEGAHFGLREPGKRTVYTVREPPSDSLSDIASGLDE